jgi:hypothetical protein
MWPCRRHEFLLSSAIFVNQTTALQCACCERFRKWAMSLMIDSREISFYKARSSSRHNGMWRWVLDDWFFRISRIFLGENNGLFFWDACRQTTSKVINRAHTCTDTHWLHIALSLSHSARARQVNSSKKKKFIDPHFAFLLQLLFSHEDFSFLTFMMFFFSSYFS